MPDSHMMCRERDDLTAPEARFLSMLRHWPLGPESQALVWADLAAELSPPRARACLSAFESFSARIARAAWTAPQVYAPETDALSPDEDALCRIVDAAARGAREEALSHAVFLVRPEALMPLLHSAERTGLPLLCAECRARLALCRTQPH
ncbi:hypothetical protein [Roseivivax sediminis]|uniref:Uncharacterized protein n=1 Tax=Roseivivax sediminis TaxID=936889 RepID=A0A1I1ZPR2_9RHOB|nr:hypothetical protein [Roseivivax sediminis]SFE32340.1 hypothetical protein SAMN04515678_108182 [Roseivivax sediminis]